MLQKAVSGTIFAFHLLLKEESEIIVNPRARSGRVVLDLIKSQGVRADCTLLAGGDGTVHRFINSRLDFKPIGLVPSGTANDLAIGCGIPCDINQALERLKSATPHTIDLISINGYKVVASVALGIPRAIVERVERWKQNPIVNILGRSLYLAAAITEVVTGSYQQYRFTITHAKGTESFYGHTMLIMNQAVIASHLVLAPEAKNNDGFFDVIIFTTPCRFRVLNTLLFRGRCGIVHRRYRCATVKTDTPVPFIADGEFYKSSSFFQISILPNALTILS